MRHRPAVELQQLEAGRRVRLEIVGEVRDREQMRPRAREAVERRHAVGRHQRAQADVEQARRHHPPLPRGAATRERRHDDLFRAARRRRLPVRSHAAVAAVHRLAAFAAVLAHAVARACRQRLRQRCSDSSSRPPRQNAATRAIAACEELRWTSPRPKMAPLPLDLPLPLPLERPPGGRSEEDDAPSEERRPIIEAAVY